MKQIVGIVLLSLSTFFGIGILAHAKPSTELIEEVIAQAKSPRQFDWRQEFVSIEYNLLSVNERNSFQSSGYSFALRKTFDDRYLGIVGLRFITTEATASTNLLAMTPFSQAAQPSRREFFMIAGLPLLAGRSFTILSPRFSDWEHVLYAKAGGHYSFYNGRWKLKDASSAILPGQRVINYQEAIEVGIRLQFSIPRSLSLFLDQDYYYPISNYDSDLSDWSSFGGGVAWTFF